MNNENRDFVEHKPLRRIAIFRFYEELNDFLPPVIRKKAFEYEFSGRPAVKNSIEAIGVPHAEVDLILVDGESVDFGYQMKGGEYVSVYPVFETLDISPLIHLREKPLRENRFVVDVNLGKLARLLRFCGFDTLYRNDLKDDEVIRISRDEKRTILTRDVGILKHNTVSHACWIREEEPYEQLKEVFERFQLENALEPFSRCSRCNAELMPVKKKDIQLNLEKNTMQHFYEFYQCSRCRQVYWKGSHYECMSRRIEQVKREVQQG